MTATLQLPLVVPQQWQKREGVLDMVAACRLALGRVTRQNAWMFQPNSTTTASHETYFYWLRY